jgi:hypothetical protein
MAGGRAELVALQDDYRTWLNALPQNLEASTTAEALRAICDLDLSDIESVEPPHGFGRDSCKGSLSPARFFYEPSGLTPAR